MNCLEFRRQLGVDPHFAGAEFVRHRQECARCAEAGGRALEFEAALRRALSVEASPQLAESILFAQATQQRQRRHAYLRRGGLLALAATLVLAVGVGMRVEANPLPAQAVAHLRGEPEALVLTAPLPAQSIREAFAKRGIALVHTVPGDVVYAACCPMGKHLTVHMVVASQGDPVTVIYLVGDRVPQDGDFEHDGWHGRSVPLEHGTLILLAHDSGQFDRIVGEWRSALQG